MNVGREITVGTIAIVKVGRNEVEVTVTGITEHGWRVKSRSTGREFEVMHLERIINRQTAEDSPNPVPECGIRQRNFLCWTPPYRFLPPAGSR